MLINSRKLDVAQISAYNKSDRIDRYIMSLSI